MKAAFADSTLTMSQASLARCTLTAWTSIPRRWQLRSAQIFHRWSSSRADTVRHRVAAADEVCAETAHRTQRRRRDVPLLSTENGLETKRSVGGVPCSS